MTGELLPARIILEKERFLLTLERLSHQLIEEFDDFSDACFVGIQTGGVPLVNRIRAKLMDIAGIRKLEVGKLDITFYRDDFRHRPTPLVASTTEMDFLVENKRVILVDDVLYTGRTIQAALTALNHYGRPRSVELLVLVDRRFNRHLPIQPDFLGITVDVLDKEYVKVVWQEDKVLLLSDK